MSLLTDLRTVASKIDPSLLPTANEVLPLVGAVIHYLEYGDKLIQAAEKGAEDVSALLSPPAPAPASAPVASAATPDTSSEQLQALQAQLQELQQQNQTLAIQLATAQKTVVTPEPVSSESTSESVTGA